MGYTLILSMFALFVMEQYALNTLAVGYITLSLAATIMFSNVVVFNALSKRISMYVETAVACATFAVAALLVPLLMHNMWAVLVVVIAGFSGSFGQIMPAISTMSAEHTALHNRGYILALANMSRSAGFVVGPLLMGALYGEDVVRPFYATAVCCALACLVMLAMLLKWPQLRRVSKPKQAADETREMKDTQTPYDTTECVTTAVSVPSP